MHRLPVQIVALLGTLVAWGCAQPDVPPNGVPGGGSFFAFETSLKAAGHWPPDIGQPKTIAVQREVILDEVVTAAGMVATGDRTLQVLDNTTGALFSVTLGGSAPRVSSVRTTLKSPRAVATLAKALYAVDATGINVLDESGTIRRTLRSFYRIGSFIPFADGTFAINAANREYEAPVIQHIDATGRVLRAWGFEDSALYPGAAVVWRDASLTVCGEAVFAARRYQPAVHRVVLADDAVVSLPLPIPARDRLLEVFTAPHIANPQPGYYQFPEFAAAVACAEPDLFALVALPDRIAVARYSANGTVQVFDAQVSGAQLIRWSDLAAVRHHDDLGAVTLYALGRNSATSQWEIYSASMR